MEVYVKELIAPKELHINDRLTFVLSNGKSLEYRVDKWYLNGISIANDQIFDCLGINDKRKFVKGIVGYSSHGWFPEVKSSEELMKVVKALANYNNPNLYITTAGKAKKEEKFTLSVKKHKCLNLNFKL